MNQEDVTKLGFSEQQEAYEKELESRRKAFRERMKATGPDQVTMGSELDKTVIFDQWFMDQCDQNPEIKKLLKPYYDCIKKGRYDKIAIRLDHNRRAYEELCLNHLQKQELTEGECGHSDLHFSLLKFSFKTLFDIHTRESTGYGVRDIQDSLAKVLCKGNFYWDILTVARAVLKSHGFVKESILFNDFGVLGDEQELPDLFRNVRLVKESIPGSMLRTELIGDDNFYKRIRENGEFLSSKKIIFSTSVSDYWKFLTDQSEAVAKILSDFYDDRLDKFFNFLLDVSDEDEDFVQEGEFDFNLFSHRFQEHTRKATLLCKTKDLLFYFHKEEKKSIEERIGISIRSSFRNRNTHSKPDYLEDPLVYVQRPPIDRLALFMNPVDYDAIFEEKMNEKRLRNSDSPLKDFVDQGMSSYKHGKIPLGCFLIIQKGSFLLVDFSHLKLRNRSYGFYKNEYSYLFFAITVFSRGFIIPKSVIDFQNEED